MSNCVKNCRLCKRFIITQDISYNATVNQLIVDLPAGSYGNCQKYCIVFAQTIPTTARLDAQIVFTIGGDQTVGYQFLNKNCVPVYASQIRTRRLYATKVNTAIGSGVFKYIGECDLPESPVNNAGSLPTT